MAERQGATGLAHLGASFASAAELCAKVVALTPEYFQEAASIYWVAVFEDAICRRDAGDLDGALAGLRSIIASDANECSAGVGAPPQEIVARAAAEIPRAEGQARIAHLELGRNDQATALQAETARAASLGKVPFIVLMGSMMPKPLRPSARRLWRMMRR
jgi:hypothetical protein